MFLLTIISSSFASERGGNTGDFEELMTNVHVHQITGSCGENIQRSCDLARKYLVSAGECTDKGLSWEICKEQDEVESYARSCCAIE